jgi:DNA-binding LacI/PurR family transcriptional regulator
MKKRVTIKDVAAQAGVTYQTVSKVINGRAQVMPETEARILAASQALGYKPNHNARSLRAQRSQMIGYSWVPTGRSQTNHILDMFLTSMVEEAEAAGYHLLPFPYREGDDHVDAYRELIDSGRVDGFVLSSVNYRDPRVRFLLDMQFPFVAFGRCEPEDQFPSVDVDGERGLRLATEHLLKLGHQRIAALAWPEDSRVGNDRMQGYYGAMRAAQVAVDPAWVARGAGTFEFGLSAASAWLALPPEARPTAVVALNDTMAIGAMHAAQSQGALSGQNFSVVGFDDSPMAQYLWPPLTSVSQPIRLAGRKCVEMLVALLRGGPLAERGVLLEPELITRQSSGPA